MIEDSFNCEFADICDFACVAPSGCVNDMICPFYKEVTK